MNMEKYSSQVNFMENPVDICVITFSSNEETDHYDLITRCLNSIIDNSDPRKYRLHIGCNNLSARAMSYVDELVAKRGAAKYIGEPLPDANGKRAFPKYPLMRKMYAATHGDWLLWFDDDIYVTENDWLEKLEQTICQNPDASQFGVPANIALPLSVKEEWIDGAAWRRPGKIQYQDMSDGRKIVSPFILGGFYALNRKAIDACHIPDKRLFHNFGDWTTGMALCHNGFKMAPFTYGIVFGDAPRRGIHKDLAVSPDTVIKLKKGVQDGAKTFSWEPVEDPPQDKGSEKIIATSSQQSLPERFSMALLEKNLSALMTSNEALVRRICLPVDGTHVRFLQNGEARYQRHQTLLPFTVSEKDLPNTLNGAASGKNVFLFGIGLGEQLDYLLKQSGTVKITVWDRDPWLIRLTLMQKDYSKLLRSGRLKLHMCSDLLDLLEVSKPDPVVCHPFLRLIYDAEYQLMTNGLEKNRAIICAGDLFVDDVGNAFGKFGYSLYTLDIKKLSIEETTETIRRFAPQIIFAVNYTNGLAELCQKLGVPLICWEVDPAVDRLKPCNSSTDLSYIFTHKKANVTAFLEAGFKHVAHLPLGADTEKRAPAILSAKEKETYTSDLSFIGSSMVGQAKSFRDLFLSHYQAYQGGSAQAAQEGSRLLEEVLLAQRKDFSTYRIPDLLVQCFGDFIRHMTSLAGAPDPFMLVGEIAAAEKRLNYIADLGHLGLKVWGDEGWRVTEQYGTLYMGGAGHTHEINKIYSGSLINVDINRLYQSDIVTMRVFDIMACGGFVLAEYSSDLEELFEIGKQVQVYHTLDELFSKASYYLAHREEAQEIARQGREAVLKQHTIAGRVQHMLNCLNLPSN